METPFRPRLVLPPERTRWSLTTLREKRVKIGARLSRHAPRLVLQMAEVTVTRDLWGQIEALRSVTSTGNTCFVTLALPEKKVSAAQAANLPAR